MNIASVFNLAGPDFIVIALIIAVLLIISPVIPALLALSILFIIGRRKRTPPPLPVAQSPNEKA